VFGDPELLVMQRKRRPATRAVIVARTHDISATRMQICVSNRVSQRFWDVVRATLGPPGYADAHTYPYSAYPNTYPGV
jgi:hypothetical protein